MSKSKVNLTPKIKKRIAQDTRSYKKNAGIQKSDKGDSDRGIWLNSPPILLPYQQVFVDDDSGVTILEKSRRTGASWAYACWATLEAIRADRPQTTYYIGTNKEMTREFIDVVGYWARSFSLVTAETSEEAIDLDDGDSVLIFRVRFATGKSVIALSSRASAIRGMQQGNVILDEAAFVESFDEIRKSIMALRMWGGKIRILSTHNGVDNPFNQLIDRVKNKEFDYRLLRVPLLTAVEMGLFRRICLITNQPWSERAEQAWIDEQYTQYGMGADEELGCIPLDVRGGGLVFNREWWQYRPDARPECWYVVRFWDMAATAAEINSDAYFTAGVMLGRSFNPQPDEPEYWIFDARARQLSPSDGDDWIIQSAIEDGASVSIRWELEGGSSGPKVESYLKKRLRGYDAGGIRPQGDKLGRAKPFASDLKRGSIAIVGNPGDGWVKRYVDALHGFDGTKKPLTNDFADATSGAYNVLAVMGSRKKAVGIYHRAATRAFHR